MLTELDHKILQTVFEEGEPISSKKLAMRCGVAVNTVRKEIALLNQEIEKQGLRIEMKSSVGAYPVILDTERALPYVNQLRILYVRSLHLEKQYSAQVYALARRCLCAAGNGLTVEKLCDEFFSSRSTILRELGDVREILERFHLQLRNRRSKLGLTVEGSEWDIRQCLVLQHKVYMIQSNGDMIKQPPATAFRSLFFMDEDIYSEISSLVLNHLQNQTRFSLPPIHTPKLSNMLLLCLSRRKFAGKLSFSPEQMALVQSTPEYRFIEELLPKLPERLRPCLREEELVSLTVILLGFGERTGGHQEYLEETEELITNLTNLFGYDPSDFDELFRQDFSCYLSQLESRRVFGLRNDPEPIGQVRHLGITTANMCLAFARFYKQKHGIALKQGDSMGCFYILNRAISHNLYCYNAQRVLVISEYGLGCARAIAEKLLSRYGPDIKKIDARSYNGLPSKLEEHWDLLVTDMPEQKLSRYVPRCSIPVLTAEFRLFEIQNEHMDAYLAQTKQQEQLKIIDSSSFHRTDLKSKEEVFSFLEQLLDGTDALAGLSPLSDYLRENDSLMDMERRNGVVFLPVFTAVPCRSRVTVLLNRTPFLWNQKKADIFVCCVYSRFLHDSRVMASILHKFIYMTPETKQEVLHEKLARPLLALYHDE